MSTDAFCPAEYSVASVLMMRAMSAPGRKLTRMLVPKYLFIAAWKRAAPWIPAKVEPLQLSVSVPSRLAAAASSFNAALISWADAAPAANDTAAAMAPRDSHERRWNECTETSRKFVLSFILVQSHSGGIARAPAPIAAPCRLCRW